MYPSIIINNAYLIFLYLILSAIFLSLRHLYQKLSNPVSSRDNYTFFNLIKNYKKNKHHIPKSLNQYIFGKNVYPCLLSWILSFIPMKYNTKIIDKYFNHIVDWGQLSLLFYISYMFTNNITICLFGALLFILSPTFLMYKARTFLLSSRALGNFLFSLFMVISYLYILNSNIFNISFLIIFVSLILLSHRFASQVLFFFSVALTFIYGFEFLIIFILGLLLAIILSKGFYIQILKGHIGQLYYFKKSDDRNDMVKGESEFLKMMKFFINPLKYRNKFKNRIILGTIYTPSLIILSYSIYYIFLNKVQFLSHIFFFSFWSIICLILLFITSFKSTRFLGQQDRYLEYSIIPLAYLSSFLLVYETNYATISIYSFIFIISIIINIRFYLSKKNKQREECKSNSYNKSKKELIKFIKKLPKSELVTIPLNFSHEIIFVTNHKALFNAGAMDVNMFKKFNKISPYYPYPDIKKIKEEYDIKYIIAEKKHLNKMKEISETKDIAQSIMTFKRIFNNKFFSVFHLEIR